MTVRPGVVWPRRSDVRDAFGPLWADGRIGVLQLTVEHAFRGELTPGFTEPLDAASARGDLVGHAVHASPVTPRDAIAHDWMARTKRVLARWPVRWITDHFGCCRAAGWHAAPLPIPKTRAAVERVRDHLSWVEQELGVPAGLENLALAFGPDDVLAQPELVDAMLEPSDGVLLLDLHNLWCQAANFGLDPVSLLERWPLHRVRQLHVAGGRWEDLPGGRFRRDTHDGQVPEEVWALVPEAVARCPRLEVAVVERLRGTVGDVGALREEAVRLADVLGRPPVATPGHGGLPGAPPWRELDDVALQDALVRAARGQAGWDEVDRLAPGWAVDPRARAVAVDVTAKWGRPVPVGR